MSEISADTEREGEIRYHLDQIFQTEIASIESILERAQGMGERDGVHTFSNMMAKRLDDYHDETDVAVVLYEEDGVISVGAYSDEDIAVARNQDRFYDWVNIVSNFGNHDVAFSPDFFKEEDFPAPFNDNDYILRLTGNAGKSGGSQYVGLRKGVIGPGTYEFHDGVDGH